MSANNSFDLSAFNSYLSERRLADDAHRTFLVRWVQRFLARTADRKDLSPDDRLQLFVDELGAEGQMECSDRTKARL